MSAPDAKLGLNKNGFVKKDEELRKTAIPRPFYF
jgi:hypothetical protein